jgi:hypothetical protein
MLWRGVAAADIAVLVQAGVQKLPLLAHVRFRSTTRVVK